MTFSAGMTVGPACSSGAAQDPDYRITDFGVASRQVTLMASRAILMRTWGRMTVFTMIAFVDGCVMSLPLVLAFEAANPDVQVFLFLADEAPKDDYAVRHLQGIDRLSCDSDPDARTSSSI
jgi:hypothetical protein